MQELDALKPVVAAVIAALQADAVKIAADATLQATVDALNAESVADKATIVDLTNQLNAALAAKPAA